MKKLFLLLSLSFCSLGSFVAADAPALLEGKKILYIERHQYAVDHHNTATLFQWGEINERSFNGGSAMRIYDVDTKKITTLIELEHGVVRDPELSYDGKKIIFSLRENNEDFYHIYEMDVDGKNKKQLTSARFVSDIDPVYLPDGNIIFSSTRQPKYCMCNRHIMANLYRMEADGANIHQIGFSTLFEGHPFVMDDGRILYDRWEYVDRNFGDAQGLWTVNPDGSKHSIYYGNNMKSPGGVIDARQIPGTDHVVCIFTSCHDRPWGALAVIDRKKGVDGAQSLLCLHPETAMGHLEHGNLDSFMHIDYHVEDPFPVDEEHFLVSSTPGSDHAKQDIYLMDMKGNRELILSGEKSLYDPTIIAPRKKPAIIPSNLPLP